MSENPNELERYAILHLCSRGSKMSETLIEAANILRAMGEPDLGIRLQNEFCDALDRFKKARGAWLWDEIPRHFRMLPR